MVGQHQQALLEWTVPLSVEQVLYLAARLNLVAEHNRPCAVLKTDIHSHSGLHVFPLSELTLSYTGVQELMHTDMQAVLCVTEGIGSHLLLQHTQERGCLALKARLLVDDIASAAVHQLLQHTWRCAVQPCACTVFTLRASYRNAVTVKL